MGINVTRADDILYVQLDRVDALNAIDAPMRDALYEAFCNVQHDPSIAAIILYGAGKGFCAGADLAEFGEANTVLQKRRIRLQHDVWEVIRTCNKLTIAAMHGFAVGSGIELAMLCDMRIAAENTVFSLPEASIGMMPAAGGTQSLPRVTTLARAIDIALTGRRFSANEAWQYGIVERIVPQDELLDAATAYAKTIIQKPYWRTVQHDIRTSAD